MKDDIIAGLKNAMERGSSLEQGVQSFINAGYNPQEVKAAASHLTSGASSIMNAAPNGANKDMKHSLPALPKSRPADGKGGKKKLKFILIMGVVLLVFVGAVSFLIYYLL